MAVGCVLSSFPWLTMTRITVNQLPSFWNQSLRIPTSNPLHCISDSSPPRCQLLLDVLTLHRLSQLRWSPQSYHLPVFLFFSLRFFFSCELPFFPPFFPFPVLFCLLFGFFVKLLGFPGKEKRNPHFTVEQKCWSGRIGWLSFLTSFSAMCKMDLSFGHW